MDPLQRINAIAQETLEVSEPIHIQRFLEKWESLLAPDELQLPDCPSLPLKSIPDAEKLLPSNVLDELYHITNPADSLYPTTAVPFQIPQLNDVPHHVKLHTVNYSASHNSMKSNKNYCLAALKMSKFRTKDDPHLHHNFARSRILREHAKRRKDNADAILGSNVGPKRIISPEAVLTITVQRPKQKYLRQKDQIKRGVIYMSVHAITLNTLTELRDAIKCPKDYEVPGDFSLNPDAISSTRTARDIFPSSMFFIEDTFYIDNRYLKAQDYSIPIIQWLKSKGCTKNFPTLNMTNQKLRSLTIRLGQPYLFVHQGDCEHVFQFTDMRLTNESDCPFSEAYPIPIKKISTKTSICNACQVRSVEWMVKDSEVSPSDPAHYCDVCFKMLHYNKDGTKVCDFQAYRYADNDFIGSL